MSDRLGTGNNASQMNNHIQDHSNPHVTTASQVGADVLGSASAVQVNLNSHTANLNNPHLTTASQVGAVVANTSISAGTSTKVQYDAKGLILSGSQATTADINDSTNRRYVTDINLTVIQNTSGTNTGNQIVPSQTASASGIFLTGYNASTGSFTSASASSNSAGITSASGVAPINVSNGSVISLNTTGISSGSYNAVTVDTFGRIISGSNIYPTASGSFYTGSAVIVVTGSIISHSGTGINSGSYTAVTVDARGHVISGSNPILDHTVNISNVGVNTHSQIDTALTRLANTSGNNTGDQSIPVVPQNTTSVSNNYFMAYNSSTGSFTSGLVTTSGSFSASGVAPISVSGGNTVSHDISGVTSGSYNAVFVDAKGHVTAGSNISTGQTYAGSAVISITGSIVSHLGTGINSGSYAALTIDSRGHAISGSNPVLDHTINMLNVGTNTHTQIDTALTRLANTTGSNTGDQIVPSLKTATVNLFLTGYNSSTGSFTTASAITSTSGVTFSASGVSPISVSGGSIISHDITGISSGSYNAVYVDTKGHVISGSNIYPVASGSFYTGSAIINVTGSIISHLGSGMTTGSYTALTIDPRGHVVSGSNPVLDHTVNMLNVGVNTHSQIDTALTRLVNTSGSNTGDQTLPVVPQNTGAITDNYFTAYNSSTGSFTTATVTAGSSGTTYTSSSPITVTGTVISLDLSGVTSGSYNQFTVDSYGRVTSASFITSSVSSGTLITTTSEINISSIPKKNGKFNIVSSGLTIGKPVIVSQSSGSITGKGTLRDENEMDHLSVSGIVTSASNIECYWSSPTKVRGNFKFDYLVSS